MELECSSITRFVLPAVRASVAESMRKKYSYNQQEIAEMLGIAQVAVSKYMNGRYSKHVAEIKKYIISNGLDREVIRYARKSDLEKVNRAINDLCAKLVSNNLVV